MKIVYNQYEIEMDRHEFLLHEKRVIKTGKKKGKEWLEFIGHYGRLANAIKRIIHLELSKNKDTITLGEYLKKHESLLEELTEHIKV